jgi:pimeloyl-ACP methyl ester carboxylesterase
MAYTTVEFDVSDAVPLGGRHHVSTWVFAPSEPAERVPLLFCLPGGSYSKAYWHLEVPGRQAYSFAEHMAARGMLVVAVDHLGTGESSVAGAIDLTPEVVAGANAAVFGEVLARARNGSLVPDLGALEIGPSVGVGHSMGAMLTLFQESLHESFDAIAPLGYGTVGPILSFDDGTPLPSYESVMALARGGALDGMPLMDRTTMRHLFYWEDVPDDVIAADDLTISRTPGVTGLLSIVPFIASDHARRIECSVFIGLGERDSTCDHHDEPRAYASSSDVTLFILPTSAHCHNSASTRHDLWNRLARWIASL